MAAKRRRARLTPTEASATVALAEAQAGGLVDNARPFRGPGGRVLHRVEVVLEPDQVAGVLDELERYHATCAE